MDLNNNKENNINIPFISIIVPVYNTEKYVGECIESVLKQSFENWELILVNDGSKDNSADICRKYKENDKRIKYFSKDNSGQYDTRLLGIRNATGQYITALDSDDYLDSDYIGKIYDYTMKTGCDVLEWSFRLVYPDRVDYPAPSIGPGTYDCFDYVKILTSKTDHSLCNKAIRREYFESDIFEKAPHGIKMSEDHMMMTTAVLNGNKMHVVDDIYYNYRRNNESITHVVTGKYILDLFTVSDFVIERFKEKAAADENFCEGFCESFYEAECHGLLKSAGKRLKTAFQSGSISKDECRKIKETDSYKHCKKYENRKYLSKEGTLAMKLFRIGGYGLCRFFYGHIRK